VADTLVLNADYRPHALVTWQEAIGYLVRGVATVVEEYTDWDVRSPSVTIKVPSVIVLLKYVVFRQRVKFNRANIYARDNYQCQYCGKKAGSGKKLKIKDLTFDHVIPRSVGGKTSWDNIATACQSCNSKKADKTPRQACMTLMQEPYQPKAVNNLEFTMTGRSIPDAWRNYLYWTQELEEG